MTEAVALEPLKVRMFRRMPRFLQIAGRLARVAWSEDGFTRHERVSVVTTMFRVLPAMWRRRDVSMRVPGGRVFLSPSSFYVDIMTLEYLWRERAFPADVRGSVVVDAGAHKGYYGAWALAHGAAFVYSFEPHSGNFSSLQRARTSNAAGERWTERRQALGESSGRAALYVSDESWAHSIQPGMVDSAIEETVEVVTLSTVLAEIRKRHPGLPVVLKVNVEGSAGVILLPVEIHEFADVVEVQFDHEPGSPYDLNRLLDHLAAAGLHQTESARPKIFRFARTGRDRAA